ncbi:MAG: U32 family peptidase [Bacilli bacterium]|nr:U32 family peptidase [Bacilli bacterium]
MKIVVVPNDIKDLDKYVSSGAEGFILGLKDYSVNYFGITIEEIKNIVEKYKDLDIFISINKTIFNKELKELEEKLIELDSIPIKGVLFYDLGVLSIYKKHNFSYSLGWHQTHMVTNYNTCNFYYDNGVEYGVLASEITKDEMIEIKRNTNMKLFSFIIGHPIMAHSKRRLLTNYYRSQNKEYDGSLKSIYERDKEYLISDNSDGTCIYEGDIISGIDYLGELKDSLIEYGIIHGFNIEDNLIVKLVSLTKEIITNNSNTAINEIKLLICNNTSFFDKKTIFKVKKDEKKN